VDAPLVLTGSHDLSATLTRLTLNPDTQSAAFAPLATLHLHTAPLASVAGSRSGRTLLTGGWDGLIGVWSADVPGEDEVPAPDAGAPRSKRRRVARADGSVKRKAPAGVLKSHTARVSRVLFGPSAHAQDVAYSCGLDSTVRVWDVENGVCTHTIVRRPGGRAPCMQR
jgi:ribosome biogenesis protein YTM1